MFLTQALWSEYTQDDATRNNATRRFCTEAFQIDVQQDRISDRYRMGTVQSIMLLAAAFETHGAPLTLSAPLWA